jgi:hypothetical protein
MLAHNKPQASTTSELLTPRPHGEHRNGTAQQQQSTQPSLLIPPPHPRQERPKRKISHREGPPSSRTSTDTRVSPAHADHLATPASSGLSHHSKRIDSQESMTPADSKTHPHGGYLQCPSFEPFGIHHQDQERQERPQRTASSIETESIGRIRENGPVRNQNIGPRNNRNDAADSNQYQLNLGQAGRTDYRSKRSPVAVGGTTKHGDDLGGHSIAQSTTTTSLFDRGAAKPHQDIHSNQHIQHSIGQPMTIRDIVDSEELRNQLAELHRSLNSNPDLNPLQYASSAQVQSRASNRPSPKYPRAPSSNAQTDRTGPPRDLRDDSVANDLTMDTSLLEKRFRARLDADLQVKYIAQCFVFLSFFNSIIGHRCTLDLKSLHRLFGQQ